MDPVIIENANMHPNPIQLMNNVKSMEIVQLMGKDV